MAEINRTPDVDDDLSGTTGTVRDAAWKDALYDEIDEVVNSGTVQIKAAGYTLVDTDDFVDFTTAGVTLSLPAANSVNTKAFAVRNSAGTGVITLDPNGAETIDGAATLALNPGDCCIFQSTGSAWKTLSRTYSGVWSSVAHAGGNFTASGTMTWTVEAGDQHGCKYFLMGKMLFVTVDVRTSTVGGSVSNTLKVTIPGGFTAAGTFYGTLVLSDNGGTQAVGAVYVESGGTVINIRKADETNWTLSTNGTRVQFTIAFEIQ